MAAASATTTVYAGKQTYVTVTWTALARSLTADLSPATLLQGHAQTGSITAYAVDASGAIIPSTQISGPGGAVERLWAVGTGPYYFKLTGFENTYYGFGASMPFRYDGLLSGTESVTVGSFGGGLRSVAASWPIEASAPSGNGKVFVQVQTVYAPGLTEASFLYQYAATAAQGPLSNFKIPTTVVAAQDDGSYWGVSATAFYHYSKAGAVLGYIPAVYPGETPGDPPQIAAATVDAKGNAYVVDQQPGPLDGEGSRAPGTYLINEYAAGGYPSAPIRTVQLVTATDIYNGQIAVDGSGNIYLYYRTGSAFAVEEIGAGAVSDASPLRTINLGGIYALSVDATGDIFVASGAGDGGQVNEYTVGGTESAIVSGDGEYSWIVNAAADAAGNCYVIYGYRANPAYGFASSIVEYPSGSTTPMPLVSSANAGLPTDAFANPMAVAP